jgi:Ca-activated chloride channel family protein
MIFFNQYKSLIFAASLSSAFLTQTYAQANGSTIDLNFLYGSEKAEWINQATEEFNKRKFKHAGKVIRVTPKAGGSGTIVEDIRNLSDNGGSEEIHIASPASELYVNWINSKSSSPLLSKAGNLVSSPVVIAAWKSTLEKKFQTQSTNIGWQDLARKASTDQTFRFGQTQPNRSNSGLSALIAQYFAGAGAAKSVQRVASLTLDDVNNPRVQDFVKSVQASVKQYGESTGWYAKKMVEDGPTNIDASVIYESDVIAANLNFAKNRNNERLVAIYPKDGTLNSEHPFVYVRKKYVSDEERSAAEIYYNFLISEDQQRKAIRYGFRPTIDLPNLEQISKDIFNARNGVATLSTRIVFLKTPSGDVISKILDQFKSTKNSVSAVLLLDVSGSMDERQRMIYAKQGAYKIIELMKDNDRLRIVPFSSSRSPLHLNGKIFSMGASGKNEAKRYLNSLYPEGGTAILDSVAFSWEELCREKMSNSKDTSMKMIFLLTDGAEQSSTSFDYNSLLRLVGYVGNESFHQPKCKIPVFAITYAPDEYLKSSISSLLGSISKATGGDAVNADQKTIELIFKKLSEFF